MFSKILTLLIFVGLVGVMALSAQPKHVEATASSLSQQEEVIVLSAPSVNDNYYAPVFDDIIDYNVLFVNTARQHTNVILLADAQTMPYLEGRVPDANLLQANINDIWIRDFAFVFPPNAAKFRYRPDYLNPGVASWIENSFYDFIDDAGIVFENYSNVKLDGGNFVHNGVDSAIITTRIFSDNPNWTQSQLEQEITYLTGITNIAFIPEEPIDTTGHSDGMVMWIEEDVLVVNQMDEPFRTQVLTPINNAFPNITIVEIPLDYEYDVWNGFVSACGLHINSLVTDTHIFMPTYDQTNDAVVQSMLESYTDKTIVPIDANNVCYMGGAVRCLTWLVQGQDAVTLLQLADPDYVPTAVGLKSAETTAPSSLWSIFAVGMAGLVTWRNKSHLQG